MKQSRDAPAWVSNVDSTFVDKNLCVAKSFIQCAVAQEPFKLVVFAFIEIVILQSQKIFMTNECMNWSVEWLSVENVARYGNFSIYH